MKFLKHKIGIIRLVGILAFILMMVIGSYCSKGQVEFIVTIDPATGVYTKLNDLPNVNWISAGLIYTALDETNNRYVFRGSNNLANNWRLHSVNGATGSIVSSPLFPVFTDPLDNIVELEYDNSTSTLYGLHWDNSEYKEYFISINPTTGAFTKIKALTGVNWITVGLSTTTFDKTNQYYIFRGGDAALIYYLYSVDTAGNIVSNPAFPNLPDPLDNVIGLRYDNNLNVLFGLHWDNSEYMEYLVSVNPTTGVITKRDSLPTINWIAVGNITYDEVNHHYIVKARNNTPNNWRLYSIDVITGNIVHNPLFPALTDPNDNVLELHYDNISQTLYGLHWDDLYIGGPLGIEDSVHSNLVIEEYELNDIYIYDNILHINRNFEVAEIYDVTGKLIVATKEIQTNLSKLDNGVYTVWLDGTHVKKIIK